ncbi:SPW repeat protein [Actinoplanes sp. NPDC026619]|uniref:SPW repeat protein n=1 Tax=Actinoplanes sp. NPDC026619 TaxID=3155798 RepID=UPI0033EEADF5
MTETTRFAMADHPDLIEMHARYERASASGPAVITDGLVLLAGLWLAISPWVIHFNATAPAVTVNNLILGIAVAVVALGLTLLPQRMVRLSWATAAIGAWVVVSQWVIQQSSSSAGIVWNNVITGGVTALLGIAAAAILMSGARSDSRMTRGNG